MYAHPEEGAAAAALAEIRADSATEVVELAPLAVSGIEALLRELDAGPVEERFGRACREATGGNPFLLMVTNPAPGLAFHWAGEVDGKWTLTDVWEDRQAYDRFAEERLLPAFRTVPGEGPASGAEPGVSEFAVHNFVRP